MKELQQIADKSTVIGDVRGAGLMIGIEIVNNKSSKEPSK
jgi:4-aminobutyrate aminotransferase-like enzyme